jgi:hypothetical protein
MVNLLLIFVYKVLFGTTVKCNGYPTKATLTCGGGGRGWHGGIVYLAELGTNNQNFNLQPTPTISGVVT